MKNNNIKNGEIESDDSAMEKIAEKMIDEHISKNQVTNDLF